MIVLHATHRLYRTLRDKFGYEREKLNQEKSELQKKLLATQQREEQAQVLSIFCYRLSQLTRMHCK